MCESVQECNKAKIPHFFTIFLKSFRIFEKKIGCAHMLMCPTTPPRSIFAVYMSIVFSCWIGNSTNEDLLPCRQCFSMNLLIASHQTWYIDLDSLNLTKSIRVFLGSKHRNFRDLSIFYGIHTNLHMLTSTDHSDSPCSPSPMKLRAKRRVVPKRRAAITCRANLGKLKFFDWMINSS